MIPRRSSADSCPGPGSDARRSSIARSMYAWIDAILGCASIGAVLECAWIGAVFGSCDVSRPTTAEVIVAPSSRCLRFAWNNREQWRTAQEEYRTLAARVKSPE